MRSILFFLLSVCYVIVSGQKVNVHVTRLTGYKTLQFVKTDDTKKNYTLGDITDPTHVAVSVDGVIAEDDWEVGLVAKSASILEVPSQPEKVLELKDTCTAVDYCMELGTPAKYIIKAKEVGDKQVSMKCIEEKSGPGKADFTLKHIPAAADRSPAANVIEVTGGVITGTTIELNFKPQKCTIETAVSADLIQTEKVLNFVDACTSEEYCMELEKPTPYVIKAKEVGDNQVNMKCIEVNGEPGKADFTLKHIPAPADRSSDANVIEVTGGVITGTTIELNFKPEKCTIQVAAAKNAITLENSTSCAAGHAKCFQNIVGSSSTTASTVGSSSTTASTDSAFDNSFTLGLFIICVLLGNIL